MKSSKREADADGLKERATNLSKTIYSCLRYASARRRSPQFDWRSNNNRRQAKSPCGRGPRKFSGGRGLHEPQNRNGCFSLGQGANHAPVSFLILVDAISGFWMNGRLERQWDRDVRRGNQRGGGERNRIRNRRAGKASRVRGASTEKDSPASML